MNLFTSDIPAPLACPLALWNDLIKTCSITNSYGKPTQYFEVLWITNLPVLNLSRTFLLEADSSLIMLCNCRYAGLVQLKFLAGAKIERACWKTYIWRSQPIILSAVRSFWKTALMFCYWRNKVAVYFHLRCLFIFARPMFQKQNIGVLTILDCFLDVPSETLEICLYFPATLLSHTHQPGPSRYPHKYHGNNNNDMSEIKAVDRFS